MNAKLDESPSGSGVTSGVMSTSSAAPKRRKSGFGWTIIFGVVLIVLVLVVLDRFVGVNIFTSTDQREQMQVEEFLSETGKWHAVFLTNGQVYFGQLDNPDAQYATLSDVYYLQLQQVQAAPAPAPSPDGEAQVVPAPQPNPPQLTLIKFGTELHAPVDFMQINRDHILFWEELTAESQVVQAISNYKADL